MKIELSGLTDIELITLISSASAELADRLKNPTVVKRVPAVERTVLVKEPGADDKDFVLTIKSLVQKGGYIKAAERRRVAEIAANYPEWVSRQQLPTDSGTGSWGKARSFHGIARAKER
ncbi:MAG: hypothetical protein REI09_05135 [Candidatus Dactylopiibacterium sp.]|nr:hypothetical protein [Candidatus Dactylopiibacterium sp.]